MVNLLQPGRGIDPAMAQQLLEQGRDGAAGIVQNAPETIQLGDFFLGLVPSNAVTAAAENQILPLMVLPCSSASAWSRPRAPPPTASSRSSKAFSKSR